MIKFKYLLLTFISLICIGLAKETKASGAFYNVISDTKSYNGNFQRSVFIQEMYGQLTSGYYNAIDLYTVNCNGNHVTVSIYKGAYTCDACTESCGQLLQTVGNADCYNGGTTTIPFAEGVYIDGAEDYFISIQDDSPMSSTSDINLGYSSGEHDGSMHGYHCEIRSEDYSSSADLLLKWYYDSNNPPNVESDIMDLNTMDIWGHVSEDYPIIPTTKYCFFDTDCAVNFVFHKSVLGETAYLVSNDWDDNRLLATTTIEIKNPEMPIYANRFYLTSDDEPLQQIEGDYTYYIAYTIGSSTKKTDDFTMYWYSSSSTRFLEIFESNFPTQEFCEKFVTDWTFDCDEGVFSVSCGLKKAINFSFLPTDASCARMLEALNNVSYGFPFNIAWSIYTTIDNATTSVSNLAPLHWWNKNTSSYQDTGVSLLSTSSFASALSFGNLGGLTMYQFYYLWFQRFIYLCGIGYVFFRLFSNMRGTRTRIRSKSEEKEEKIDQPRRITPKYNQ